MTTTNIPSPPSAQTGLPDGLVRLTHLVQSAHAEAGRAQGLTPQQTRLLCVLHSAPIEMAELGPLLHLEKSSLTGLVDRVEQRGLVTRVRNAGDRRTLKIALTKKGARLALRAHKDVTARLEALTADLALTEQHRLTALISQVVAQHPATPSGPGSHGRERDAHILTGGSQGSDPYGPSRPVSQALAQSCPKARSRRLPPLTGRAGIAGE